MNYEEMQPHQQRVVDEKRELDDKIYKLTMFVNSTNFPNHVGFSEQARLKSQLGIMESYSDILGERIDAFGEVDL